MGYKKEVWKTIPGYPHYQVSDKGRVRSLDRTIKMSRGGKYNTIYEKTIKGQLLKPGRNTKQGHVTVSLGRYNSINVHRLVMLAFKGQCPKGKEVLHINGKADDNRLINLRYGTRSENNRDISRHGKRKITEAIAKKVKYGTFKKGELARLAKELGVGRNCLSNIRGGWTWKWV